jgi:hypothetical protein
VFAELDLLPKSVLELGGMIKILSAGLQTESGFL